MTQVFVHAHFGDSLTSGYLSRDWQVEVETRLSLIADRPVWHHDCGELGTTSTFALANIKRVIDPKPDVVTLAFGMNDAAASLGISVSTFSQNLRDMIAAIRAATPRTAISLMTMNGVIGSFDYVIDRANLPLYWNAVRSVAVEQSVGLIDNNVSYGTLTSDQMVDGVHPEKPVVFSVLVPNVVSAIGPLL